jgi:hypothetical protein
MGRDLVSEIIPDDGSINLDSLRDDISDRAHELADNAVIYYSDCTDIIAQYESDPRADTDSADHMGQTFKPSEWQEAKTAYAYWIARSIIEAEAIETVDAIGEAVETLTDELDKLAVEYDADSFRLSAYCPHGWAAHNRESAEGTCFWVSRQLDGCNSVAVPVCGMWVSFTWEPSTDARTGKSGVKTMNSAVKRAIAAYREAIARQAAMPESERWRMGAEIKMLKAKAYVEMECR